MKKKLQYIPKIKGRGRHATYRFAEIRVGDKHPVEFAVADKQHKMSIRSALYHHRHRHGGEFVTRITDDGKRLRIWRVK